MTILAYPTAALTPSLLADLREDYGIDLPRYAGGPVVRTLLGHLDREGCDDLRAGEIGVTVAPIPLTDGRHAVAGEWSPAFIAALSTDPRIAVVDILTPEQFQALLPSPTEIQ